MSMPYRRIRPARVSTGRRQRRKLVWATQQSTSVALPTGNKQNIDLLGNLETAGSSILGATVMRTHTIVNCVEANADTGKGVFLGWIVDSATTATTIDPSTGFGFDWMLLTVLPPELGKSEFLDGTNLRWAQEYDLRSKRKIEELAEKYFLCIQNQGSGTVTFSSFSRTLLALP